jgi:hypothetical protein
MLCIPSDISPTCAPSLRSCTSGVVYASVSSSPSVTLFTIRDTTWVSSLRELFFILLIGVSADSSCEDFAVNTQIFGFVAQMLLTLGIQRERVGRAGIALYLSVCRSTRVGPSERLCPGLLRHHLGTAHFPHLARILVHLRHHRDPLLRILGGGTSPPLSDYSSRVPTLSRLSIADVSAEIKEREQDTTGERPRVAAFLALALPRPICAPSDPHIQGRQLLGSAK